MALGDYFQFVFALAFVLVLILGAAWAFRRYGRGSVRAPRRGSLHRRRLGIVEAIALDTRRKLVLVRRDDREHLIIVGTQGETVVESGIVAEDGRTLERPFAPAQDSHLHPIEDGHPIEDRHPPAGRRGPRPKPTSFLRLVRETTREPS